MIARERAREAKTALAGAGIADAACEAEILVRDIARISRVDYFRGAAVPEALTESVDAAIERRLRREPTAYIRGNAFFYGREFSVSPDVLIPRPETELLIDILVAEKLPEETTVLDVGTGSGCLAISLALETAFTVLAVDASPSALRLARRNAVRHAATVTFMRGHLASGVAAAGVIVANLPYIATDEIAALEPEVRDWEPRIALDGGHDGLDLIRELIADCGNRLKPRLLALEVGMGQAAEVAHLCQQAGAATAITRDLAGIERVVTARWA